MAGAQVFHDQCGTFIPFIPAGTFIVNKIVLRLVYTEFALQFMSYSLSNPNFNQTIKKK